MTTNTNLIHAIADALIETHGQGWTGWLESGDRAKVELSAASPAGRPQSGTAPGPTGPRTSSSCVRIGA